MAKSRDNYVNGGAVARRTRRMITARRDERDRFAFAREDGDGSFVGDRVLRVFPPLKGENCADTTRISRFSLPILYPLTATVLLYIPTRPSSSLSRIISPKFPKLVRPPRKLLTRSILRRSERRRYRLAGEKGFAGNTGRRFVDSEPCIVPRVSLLPNVKYSGRLLRFLKLQYQTVLYGRSLASAPLPIFLHTTR